MHDPKKGTAIEIGPMTQKQGPETKKTRPKAQNKQPENQKARLRPKNRDPKFATHDANKGQTIPKIGIHDPKKIGPTTQNQGQRSLTKKNVNHEPKT